MSSLAPYTFSASFRVLRASAFISSVPLISKFLIQSSSSSTITPSEAMMAVEPGRRRIRTRSGAMPSPELSPAARVSPLMRRMLLPLFT